MVFKHSACASLYSLAPPARTVCVSPLWVNFYYSEDHHGTGRSGHGIDTGGCTHYRLSYSGIAAL